VTQRRILCVVPHCPRTRRPHPGDGDDPEWICGDHWALVPKIWKQSLSRAYRRWKKEPSNRNAGHWWLIWQKVKRTAIETALGI
jgi:hypothetical protein